MPSPLVRIMAYAKQHPRLSEARVSELIERFPNVLEQYYPGHIARMLGEHGAVTVMPPGRFLETAAPYDEQEISPRIHAIQELFKRGELLRHSPQLHLYNPYGISDELAVIGHDGRARALALQNQDALNTLIRLKMLDELGKTMPTKSVLDQIREARTMFREPGGTPAFLDNQRVFGLSSQELPGTPNEWFMRPFAAGGAV